MKYGFFSDVHGNQEALVAVLEDARIEKVDTLYFLGDAVGYGTSPNECVRLITENARVCLMGNHDYAALELIDLQLFNQQARQTLEWTKRVLEDKTRQALANFDLDHTVADFYLVHASPREPLNWDYILTLEDAEECFPFFSQRVCLIGHTHRPVLLKKKPDSPLALIPENQIEIDKGARFLINIGSVGQPRDGDPRASYLIYDTQTKQATLKRVAYNVQATQQKMAANQMPQFLIERIATGR